MLISMFQPVETVYVGSPTKAAESGKKEKSVAILGELLYYMGLVALNPGPEAIKLIFHIQLKRV